MGQKLFVGNLSFDTTSSDLETLFGEVGQCQSASVITDRDTGRSRGFAFVEMASSGEAQEAIQRLNGREIQGRAINVSEAKERAPRSGGFGGGGGGGGRGGRRAY
jgi:RNA recognition motif-containing protein